MSNLANQGGYNTGVAQLPYPAYGQVPLAAGSKQQPGVMGQMQQAQGLQGLTQQALTAAPGQGPNIANVMAAAGRGGATPLQSAAQSSTTPLQQQMMPLNAGAQSSALGAKGGQIHPAVVQALPLIMQYIGMLGGYGGQRV